MHPYCCAGRVQGCSIGKINILASPVYPLSMLGMMDLSSHEQLPDQGLFWEAESHCQWRMPLRTWSDAHKAYDQDMS